MKNHKCIFYYLSKLLIYKILSYLNVLVQIKFSEYEFLSLIRPFKQINIFNRFGLDQSLGCKV